MNQDLLAHIKQYGSAYNTEDSSLFFYALTRMQQFKTFIEFGTGLGCTSFAVAYAMKENKFGKCITFDNGSEYEEIENVSYKKWINSFASKIEIEKYFTLKQRNIDFQSVLIDNVDCVFSDFDRSEDNINKLMSWALYSMNDYSSIFIDGLYNYKEGFYYTKLLVSMLNENTIPNSLTFTEKQKMYAKKFVEDHSFSLTTIRKHDKNNIGQDSMCWIKIESNNI